ncbi:MAG: type IV pilin N-terminal domain-containing protein [Methanosarcina mazei]
MPLGGFALNIFEKFIKDPSGVSSVLGEVLIAGIVVIALGSLFVIMTSADKPVDSTHLSAEEWIDAPFDVISLRHAGGESVDVENLKINVQINGTNYVYSSSNISENLGGKGVWELADVIQINTSQEWGVGIADEENVNVKLIDTGSKEVLPKYRIGFSPELPSPIDFEIIDDTVVPQEDFISSFNVLGAAISMGSYDMMVTSRLKVGSETFDPWGDYALPVTSNVNDGSTHSWDLPATYQAGTSVTISGKSWQHKAPPKNKPKLNYNLDASWEGYMEVNSTDNSDNLIVLRNGDSVPTIQGMDKQPDIADFVEDYVENGKIVLEDNEAIFLFELGTTDLHNSAADFQDLVVLMTIDPAPAS